MKSRSTEVFWHPPGETSMHGLKVRFAGATAVGPAKFSAEASADPKSEVVEALRWVRQLLASGRAKAEEIAVAAASTPDWDDYFLAYANDAELPLTSAWCSRTQYA